MIALYNARVQLRAASCGEFKLAPRSHAARSLGVNASQAAEAGIAAAMRRARKEAWLKANQAAIDEHAIWLDRYGMPLEPAWLE